MFYVIFLKDTMGNSRTLIFMQPNVQRPILSIINFCAFLLPKMYGEQKLMRLSYTINKSSYP